VRSTSPIVMRPSTLQRKRCKIYERRLRAKIALCLPEMRESTTDIMWNEGRMAMKLKRSYLAYLLTGCPLRLKQAAILNSVRYQGMRDIRQPGYSYDVRASTFLSETSDIPHANPSLLTLKNQKCRSLFSQFLLFCSMFPLHFMKTS